MRFTHRGGKSKHNHAAIWTKMSFQESFSDKLPLFLILSIGHFSGIQTNLQNPFNIRFNPFHAFHTNVVSAPPAYIYLRITQIKSFFFKINIHKCNVPLDYRNIWKMVETINIFSHNCRAINYMQKRHDLFPFIRANIIWASAWDFQQCGMCDQQSLRSACAYAQSDHSLC